MVQNVFQRVEKKYLLNEAQFESLKRKLADRMQVDAYGLHTIRNVYFDTKDQLLIRTSLEKPCYKEKFRIRCYGMPDENAQTFLEIKKKYKGIVYKRRIAMPYAEAYQYLYEGKNPGLDSQIFREIDYFKMRYELQPEMYLAYDRLALFGKEDPEFRVTFDKNIRSRKHDPVLLNDTDTIPLLEKGYHLMEVKIAGAVPLWFAVLLSEEKIYPVSFSKYGNVYLNQLAAGNYRYGTGDALVSSVDAENYAKQVIPGVLVLA